MLCRFTKPQSRKIQVSLRRYCRCLQAFFLSRDRILEMMEKRRKKASYKTHATSIYFYLLCVWILSSCFDFSYRLFIQYIRGTFVSD